MAIIESGINPNCSETTVRIQTDDQNEEQVQKLIEKLELELDCDYYNEPIEEPNWDDEKPKDPVKEFDMTEGSVYNETIFGINCIRISGDAPYNCGQDLMNIIKRYLPHARTEWSE